MEAAFNWEQFYSTSKWVDIRDNCPLLTNERPPTLINKQKAIAYFSSVDFDCSLVDHKELHLLLALIKNTFSAAVKSKNYYKAACAESDFHTIQQNLVELGFPSDETLE